MTWETVKLGEVCSIEKGNIGIMKAIPGEYPLVVLGEERRTHNEFQFDDDAVIIPLVSSTGHGHRSMKRIFFQTGKFSIGSILCAVIPKDKTQLSAEFLYRYLDFNKENELVGRMRGMANVTLPMKEIAEVEIPLPSLEIQTELISEFQKLESGKDQISTELYHQLALVKELRQAYLREAMQGKLVPQDPTDEPAEILLDRIKAEKEKLHVRTKRLGPIDAEEIRFAIPSIWTWCRLNDICESIVDCPHSTPKYLDHDTGFYGIDTNCIDAKGNIVKLRSLSEESYIERIRRLVPTENDIVYSREGSIGLAAFIPPDKKICLGQRVMLLRSSKMINLNYLKFVISSEVYKNRLLEKHRGIGAKHVNVKDIINSLISLPPLAEQERIVAKLEKLMKFCDELEANIKQGITNADRLLQTALREALESK